MLADEDPGRWTGLLCPRLYLLQLWDQHEGVCGKSGGGGHTPSSAHLIRVPHEILEIPE